jgi:malonyl-CoA O-methyltransferase
VLAREVGMRMAERLDYMKIEPQRMADIGCATGDGIRSLQTRYPKAQALAVDVALTMLQSVQQRSMPGSRLARFLPALLSVGSPRVHCLNADVRALPLNDASLDLIWSNLMLHWLEDPRPALDEMHRTLNTGGLLMFATLGPDTLREIRDAFKKVGAGDTAGTENSANAADMTDTIADTTMRFTDMHDLGDLLVAAGFGDPVMDMESIDITYPHPRQFLADQRHLGVRDAFLGHQSFRTWRKIFSAWQADPNGRWPMRFEVIYGHAWKPAPRPAAKTMTGHAVINFHRS